ncbi:Na+/melibiose symporter-like transporter [Sphingomonas zeicaulis]|uniref:MFS transporter n=1 Tax=Sphingomonas zeicaulis TaxID=1632740 RepID=UPI003D19092F
MRSESAERLSLVGLVAFSLPMVVVQTIETAWRVYLPNFFSTTLGLSLGMAGFVLMAARLFDSLIDPLIGWASDRFPTRYGHRRPWLVAGTPLIVIGALGAFFVWPWTGPATLIAACLLLHLGYMMMVTPHGGWALELGRDAAERLRIIGAKTWFAVAGGIAILFLPALLERMLGIGREGQVAALGLSLILFTPLSMTLVLRFVAEPMIADDRRAELGNPLRLFWQILRTRSLHPVLLLYLFAGLSDSAMFATFLLFIERGLALEGWASSLLLAQSAVPLLTLPLWGKLAGRIGHRRLLMLAYGWQVAVMPLALLLPAGQIAPAILFLIARSLFMGVDYLLLRTMVSEITRAAALTGLRQGASCYSVSNITLKLAMGLGAWMALAAIGGTSASGAAADASLWAIRLAYALPPVLCGLAALLVLGQGRRRAAAGVPAGVVAAA